MTKKERMIHYYRQYLKTDKTELYQVYNKCSNAKQNAMKNCRADMVWRNGTGLKILSHTAHFFTIGYEYPDEKTGEVCFLVDTGRNIYTAKLSDIQQ